MTTEDCGDSVNSYVKLNVGGTLFYTTIGTLLRGNTMLNAMFSGRMEVKTDDEGWVLIDRSGKHFGTILNYMRDGSVPLPETRREMEELLAEARYFCVDGLRQACEDALARMVVDEDIQNRATIVIVKCPNAAKSLLSSTKKPVVKLTMNRYNNVFSYTSNSHDNLLRNIECLEKYALMFPDKVLFVKDVRDKSEQNEICEWSYYYRGHRLKSIDCIAIHYSSEKRLIKVEFPESRIHEEMLSLLSVDIRGLSDAELRDIAMRKANCGSGSATAPFVGNPVNVLPSIVSEQDEPDLDQTSTTTVSGSVQSHSTIPPARPVLMSTSHLDAIVGGSGSPSTRAPFATSVRLGRR
ncbi:BTB/POZ domain-containing adapter for CUL3-mediated RhoA degradation protein [Clonorchis sinensis]|uniref:BTB/POZ domain-containing adapter for CUL3-mediated RhoA degradation protein n=1 Tax=Clonorchis sinensis TaxID=79923 RepID=G7YDB3_CLOSI|nr:BTB/POZ domain-containing adapter for CUL3-mediated RhoA degradation protein [Clonorchis sinensis]